MPLVTDEGFAPDRWHRAGEDESLDGCARVLVPLDRFDEALAEAVEPIGVEIGPDADLDRLVPHLSLLALIAVRFASFADGRGFSLARRLRRLGFTGRLRATGPVIADQWPFLRACGVDEAEIPDALAHRQPEASWRAASASMSGSYQRRLGEARTAAPARRRA